MKERFEHFFVVNDVDGRKLVTWSSPTGGDVTIDKMLEFIECERSQLLQEIEERVENLDMTDKTTGGFRREVINIINSFK